MSLEYSGAPGRTRTLSLLIRSQTLYPIELRALNFKLMKLEPQIQDLQSHLGTLLKITR